MTDSKIPELLVKLRELDLETYNTLYDRWGALEDGGKSMVRGYKPELIPGFGWFDLVALQGVIQDAIAANDNFIGFEITYTSYFDVKYEAEIFWDQTGEILMGFGETAADALLAAYIVALEVMR